MVSFQILEGLANKHKTSPGLQSSRRERRTTTTVIWPYFVFSSDNSLHTTHAAYAKYSGSYPTRRINHYPDRRIMPCMFRSTSVCSRPPHAGARLEGCRAAAGDLMRLARADRRAGDRNERRLYPTAPARGSGLLPPVACDPAAQLSHGAPREVVRSLVARPRGEGKARETGAFLQSLGAPVPSPRPGAIHKNKTLSGLI